MDFYETCYEYLSSRHTYIFRDHYEYTNMAAVRSFEMWTSLVSLNVEFWNVVQYLRQFVTFVQVN